MERSAAQAGVTAQAREASQSSDDAPPDGPLGEPSTRARILDIALELFNEQGYDKTSLREIAERLGTTKAAIYYHFERKQDILLELHLRLHHMGRDAFERIAASEPGGSPYAAWPALVDDLIDQVIANRDLFVMHQRNRSALEQIGDDERHLAENEDLEQQIRRLLANPALSLTQRVRMASSIGAILTTLIGQDVFGDVPIERLAEQVREVTREILRPG